MHWRYIHSIVKYQHQPISYIITSLFIFKWKRKIILQRADYIFLRVNFCKDDERVRWRDWGECKSVIYRNKNTSYNFCWIINITSVLCLRDTFLYSVSFISFIFFFLKFRLFWVWWKFDIWEERRGNFTVVVVVAVN